MAASTTPAPARRRGSHDRHLLAGLSADTAESVMAWLVSRGRDQPVHIPLSTIRQASTPLPHPAWVAGWLDPTCCGHRVRLAPDRSCPPLSHLNVCPTRTRHALQAREIFALIDTDKSGTLEAEELLAVFQARAPCRAGRGGSGRAGGWVLTG